MFNTSLSHQKCALSFDLLLSLGCRHLRWTQPLQLHSLLIPSSPWMILRQLTSYSLGWLAARLPWPGLICRRWHDQIFIVHDFSPIVHFYLPIFPLTDQRFGFRGPIAPVLRLSACPLTRPRTSARRNSLVLIAVLFNRTSPGGRSVGDISNAG
jgi:hypothetical protein